MENAKTYLVPLGRLLLSSLFIWAGFGKLIIPSGTAQYFASLTCPGPEHRGVAGHHYRIDWRDFDFDRLSDPMGGAGAGDILLDHRFRHPPAGRRPAKHGQLLKNLTMAGGFLYVVSYGAGNWSVDGPSK